MELYAEVRRSVYVEGLSERAAARRFGLARETVRKMLRYSVPPGYRRAQPVRCPKLDGFTGVIDQILGDDQQRPKKQRHTAKRIWERLRAEHAFTGGYTIVTDFGEALVVIAGVECKAHYLVVDLPHSDDGFVKAFPAETTEAFCDGHNAAVGYFDGVPRRIVYDNTKLAVARILGDGTRQRTRVFSELQSHYLFDARFGRPGKGNDKGKVEGLVGYARRNFFVPVPRFPVDKMSAGTKGRRQSLIFEITNSGYDRTSVAWAHHEYSRQVLEGTVENDQWFAYVCGLDDGDDPLTDETCWSKANPSLDVTIQPSYLRTQVRKALGIPTETATVMRLNFCSWTRADAPAIDMGAWDACPSAPLDDSELLSAPCYGGLDLGLSSDFSAFVLLWMLPDGRVAVRPTIWLPEAAIEAHPSRPYDAWQRMHLLTVSFGDVTDFAQVQDTVLALCQRWRVREVAYDQRFASQFAQNLGAAGIEMVNCPQGFALNEACQTLFTLIAKRQLCHEGHAVLAWMASNLTLKHGPQQQVMPDKAAAGDKIDGIVALLMALSRAIVAPAEEFAYDTRGILTI